MIVDKNKFVAEVERIFILSVYDGFNRGINNFNWDIEADTTAGFIARFTKGFSSFVSAELLDLCEVNGDNVKISKNEMLEIYDWGWQIIYQDECLINTSDTIRRKRESCYKKAVKNRLKQFEDKIKKEKKDGKAKKSEGGSARKPRSDKGVKRGSRKKEIGVACS